jgi:hypothetical protein
MANFNQVKDITVKPGASVNGLQLSTVNAIDSLEAGCRSAKGSCSILITSGTDSHAAGTGHAVGNKADFQPNANLDAYITSLPKGVVRSDGAQTYLLPGGGSVADERTRPPNCGTSCGWSGSHWDMKGPGH